MQLRDIVEINQQGLVADAVSLKMMADESNNLRLCKGFVFNYDAAKAKGSTLGVLDALRESFHSANNANIHLMVQDFGKGKSHFALTIANFFKKTSGSPEIEGILHQINFATAGQNQALHEKLKAYKQRIKPHLVVCISGEVAADLGKMLLQAIRNSLEENGIGDAIAQHLIQKPLAYLKQLTSENRIKAEQYLEEIGRPHGDLDTMTELLEEDHYDVIPIVREISARIEYEAFDFEYNLDVQKILEDIIQRLCTGEERQFEGVLILFDELNAYLRTWLRNQNAAGGYTLQNITNVCSTNRGKVALFCLAQIKPSMDTQVPYLERKNYERFTTRIELAPSTYEPKASLELVIDNLLKQSSDAQWQEFRNHWDNTLLAEARISYDRYITAYSNRNWPFEEFHKHLGLGCYPLHPLTTYLLCNLGFTQGRTAIQFIKEDVAKFIESKSVALDGELQFVRPVQLIDAFASNFAQQSSYADYEKAYDAIAASASLDEINVLKAVALYYLSGEKITKPERERHEEVLSVMTGFSISKTKKILEKISQDYQVIYYNSGNNTYRFYSGFSLIDLLRKIEEETEGKTPDFNSLLMHCRRNLSHYLGSNTVRAERFVNDHRLNGEDWQFEREIFTIDEFQRVLSSERLIKGISQKGLIACFIGEYTQDMAVLEKTAESILAKAPKAIQERVILSIPRQGTGKLARILMMKEALNQKSSAEKQEFGPAYSELTKQFDDQLDSELQDIFDSCIYTCRIIHKVPLTDRKRLECIVSKMLDELYTYVAPVENQDKLRNKSNTGSSIISFASRHLLANDLKEPFLNQAYTTLINTVFIRRWQLLKPGNPYTVQVPKDPNVRQAWDTISAMTEIGDKIQTTLEIKKIWDVLYDAPYGYNELTFTLLFSAWLTYHRAEVELAGSFGIAKTKKDQVSVRTAPIQEWVQTNILEKPKDFVQVWIILMGNKVVRRKAAEFNVPNSVDYESAIEWVNKITQHLQSGLLDLSKANVLEQKQRQLEQGIATIDSWLKPITDVQALLDQKATLGKLASFYISLEVKPPSALKEEITTVRATEAQNNAWRHIQQELRERIEALVKDLVNQVQTFETADQGYKLKADIDHKLKSLENISELPSRFTDSLRTASETTDQRITELNTAEKIKETLQQIQNLYRTLGVNALQSQFNSVQSRIQEIADQTPLVQQDSDYLEILASIENQQDQLIRQLDLWETQFSDVNSRGEALKLSREVNRELNRFDQEESSQQIKSLIARIEAKVLEKEVTEAEESALEDAVQKARQKVRLVVSLNNLVDATQAYVELSQIVLPYSVNPANYDNYHQQLESLKIEGKQAIEQKFEQLLQTCERDLISNDDYTKLKGSIAHANQLIAGNLEFLDLQGRIQKSEESLEVQYLELKKRIDDNKVLEELQQLRPAMGNTVMRCEEIISQVESSRSRLNFPDQHIDNINKLINVFQEKRTEYNRSLHELEIQIQAVETNQQLQRLHTELSKLEFIFRDSTDYERYQTAEVQLNQISEDLEKISSLEIQGRDAKSVITLEELRCLIVQTQSQLYDSERFQIKLYALEESISQRQQQFVNDLFQWQQTLETLVESSQARKLQSQVGKQHSRYVNSEYGEIYDTLRADLDVLSQLLALVNVQKTDSIEACQAELERLEEWQTAQNHISTLVENRLQGIRINLVHTKQSILERQCNAAQKWLSDLQNRVSQLEITQDANIKLETAKALLKEIRQTRSRHEIFLEDGQKDALISCRHTCEAIQNQNRASQIETLFQELPKDERIELYQRLGAYLETTTEVF